jgi:hypothetical protein
MITILSLVRNKNYHSIYDKNKFFYIKKIYSNIISNFSEIRNNALEKITTPWVFVLDSDEEVTKELINVLPKLITNPQIDGYWFRRKYIVDGKWYLRHGLFYPDWQLRLFRNKKEYRYKGAVHEILTIPKEKTLEVPYDILHNQNPPKLTSWKGFELLKPYMEIAKNEYRIQLIDNSSQKNNVSNRFLINRIIYSCIHMLVLPMTRGKGFLDGYNGFRAHVLLTLSIVVPMIKVITTNRNSNDN